MLRTLLLAVVVTALAGWLRGRPFARPADAQADDNEPVAVPQSYLCYDSQVSKGAAKFAPIPNVSVTDFFESLFFTINNPEAVCNPVTQRSGDGLSPAIVPETSDHLVRYDISVKKGAKENLQKNVLVETQFGTFYVDMILGDKLMVPAAKGIGAPPQPLQSVDIDHFHCYDIKLHKGSKLPKGLQATIVDQFSPSSRTFDVVKFDHVCPAAQKRAESVPDPCGMLACFDVKEHKGTPKFSPVKDVYTVDQFGTLRQDALREEELCVPADIPTGESSVACVTVENSSTSTVTSTTSTSTSTTSTVSSTTSTSLPESCTTDGDCGYLGCCLEGSCQFFTFCLTLESTTSTSTSTTSTMSTTSTTLGPQCAPASCTAPSDCTSGSCDTMSSAGTCAPVCADPFSTCSCNSDCTSGFCDNGACAPQCVGATTKCGCDNDCTSGTCNTDGMCAPVSVGNVCSCGSDCTSGNCGASSAGVFSITAVTTCQPNCAPGPCGDNGDCTSGSCNTDTGLCNAVTIGNSCVCGGDCTSQHCDDGTSTCATNCAPDGLCSVDTDCSSGSCVSGNCAPATAGHSCSCGGDCFTQHCDDGTHTCAKTCVLDAPDGTCGSNDDCYNGNCVSGFCAPASYGSPCHCGSDCDSHYCMDDGTCG